MITGGLGYHIRDVDLETVIVFLKVFSPPSTSVNYNTEQLSDLIWLAVHISLRSDLDQALCAVILQALVCQPQVRRSCQNNVCPCRDMVRRICSCHSFSRHTNIYQLDDPSRYHILPQTSIQRV